MKNKAAQILTGKNLPKRAAIGATVLALGAGAYLFGPFDGHVSPSAANANNVSASAQSVMPQNFADVVEKVSPAVVNIQVTSRSKPEYSQMRGTPGDKREFFDHFFGERHGAMPHGKPERRGHGQQRMGAGSGFVIDEDGHIVTNEHVVRDADEITVTFKDGRTEEAILVGQDRKTDLAVLKIETDKPVPHVTFGDSDKVRVGEWILTVGNPFGLGHSVNVGIVSARGRTIGAGPYDDFLQIDAQINRGNSGGPAFDMAGNVVGVNAAIFSPNGGNVGIGFAIPAAIAKDVIADLKADGIVERGWLGVHIQPVTEDIAESLGRDDDHGALVSEVRPDSPAAAAKIKTGDVILSVEGETIEKLRELPRLIAGMDPGSEINVIVWRDGAEKVLSVDLGRLPGEQQRADVSPAGDSGEAKIGLALRSLDPETAEQMGLERNTQGVVIVGVEPGSPAAEKGLREGDVLTQAAGKQVSTPEDVAALIKDARKSGKKSVLGLIKRGDRQTFVAIPLGAA